MVGLAVDQNLAVSIQAVIDVVIDVVKVGCQVETLVVFNLEFIVEESGWVGMLSVLAQHTHVLDTKSQQSLDVLGVVVSPEKNVRCDFCHASCS